ncbi:MAG: hypothetical protein WC974_00300 [Thermoplasmata archaeon]
MVEFIDCEEEVYKYIGAEVQKAQKRIGAFQNSLSLLCDTRSPDKKHREQFAEISKDSIRRVVGKGGSCLLLYSYTYTRDEFFEDKTIGFEGRLTIFEQNLVEEEKLWKEHSNYRLSSIYRLSVPIIVVDDTYLIWAKLGDNSYVGTIKTDKGNADKIFGILESCYVKKEVSRLLREITRRVSLRGDSL